MNLLGNIFLATTLSLVSITLSAQESNHIELMKGNIPEAKKQVDANIKDPNKIDKAETWYLASVVYTRMAKSEVYLSLEPYPGEKALEYMKKSIAIDSDRKLYSEQINVMLDLGPSFYNKAINNYNKAVRDSSIESYKLALRYFEDYFELLNVLKDDEKFVKQIIELSGVNHNDIYFYAGYSSQSLQNIEKALKYYSTLMDYTSEKEIALKNSKDLAFLYTAKIYQSEKKYEQAIKAIKRGVELYPQNDNMVMTAIILYKEADKMDEMIVQMEEVIKKNPNNIKLLFLLARNYTKYGKSFAKTGYLATSEKYYNLAIDYYGKALDLNPEDQNTVYAINYNLGVLYYNKGAFEYKKGEDVDLNKLQSNFTKAKPLLTKANILKPNPNIDKMLKTINNTLGE